MFSTVRIRNFRSLRDSGPIELTNLNVLVGPNNSGKSSVLYALMLIKMTLEEKDRRMNLVTCTPELDLGSYYDIIRERDVNNHLRIDIAFDKNAIDMQEVLCDIKGREDDFKVYGQFNVEYAFTPSLNKIEVLTFTGKDKDGKNIFSIRKGTDDKYKIIGPGKRVTDRMAVSFNNFIPVLRGYGSRPSENIVREVIKWFLNTGEMADSLATVISNLKYIAPIRERIPRHGIIGTMSSSELGPSGQNLMRVLSTDEPIDGEDTTIINQLNNWLDKVFRILRNVKIENVDTEGTIKTLIADDRKGSKNVNLASMGCGISQLVPVILQTILMPDKGCLLVEQPEIHLHPSAQADLADLFIRNAKKNKQYIIETHSEHFVLRLRRRVAEGKIKADRVKIFYVEKVGGVTKIKHLSLKENGHFDKWPKGFFEEGYAEALAIAEASHKRKSS